MIQAQIQELQLDYCSDYFREYVEFAESYVPGITEEFCQRFDWRWKKWLERGVTIRMNGETVS